MNFRTDLTQHVQPCPTCNGIGRVPDPNGEPRIENARAYAPTKKCPKCNGARVIRKDTP